MPRPVCIALCCALLFFPYPALAVEVEVLGLFKGRALLRVDGQQKLVSAGQALGGVQLISADSRAAVVEIAGQQHTMSLSSRIGSDYTEATSREVSIPRNSQLQYLTNAAINGRQMQVMVDTGANIVALNAGHAEAIGIDYRKGKPVRVGTAGGDVDAWEILLNSVDVGGIRVDKVLATVIPGPSPDTILLGMTYLRHVSLSENNGVLVLSRDF